MCYRPFFVRFYGHIVLFARIAQLVEHSTDTRKVLGSTLVRAPVLRLCWRRFIYMNIQKKTKIVATIGPATESEKMIEKLFLTGLDVVRLNFSHGDHEEHQKRVDIVKKISKKIGKNVAILQDLAGPKIRIGDFATERIQLKEGQFFTLTTEKITGDEKRVYINYPNLSEDVKIGGFVLLDDGKRNSR